MPHREKETEMVKEWKQTGSKTIVSTRVFEIQQRHAINPRTDQEIPFFVLDSVHWVNVVPLLDDDTILMVRQYRMGTGKVTLEIPGGMTERDEAPEIGAQRELLEETGYDCESLELLGVVDTNPAIQTNSTYTYIARGLREVGDQQQDAAEDIEVVKVALDQIDELVANGEITHSLVIAALYWLDRARSAKSAKSAKNVKNVKKAPQKTPETVQTTIDDLARVQGDKVAALAKRINSRLTPEDLRNPQDFPELANDPDFNYQDGMLAGIETARMALRRKA